MRKIYVWIAVHKACIIHTMRHVTIRPIHTTQPHVCRNLYVYSIYIYYFATIFIYLYSAGSRLAGKRYVFSIKLRDLSTVPQCSSRPTRSRPLRKYFPGKFSGIVKSYWAAETCQGGGCSRVGWPVANLWFCMVYPSFCTKAVFVLRKFNQALRNWNFKL